jgi:hypothetical protein
VHAVVEAFDVNSNDAIKVFLGRTLDRADMRDAGVIDEDVNALVLEQLLELGFHFRLLRHIASVRGCSAASGGDSCARCGCGEFIYVQNSNHGAARRESQSNGLPNAAAAASDQGDFAIQPESSCLGPFVAQSETPRFQGMKSSCAFCSALVRTSPLAT